MTISVRVWDRGQACSGALARIESTTVATKQARELAPGDIAGIGGEWVTVESVTIDAHCVVVIATNGYQARFTDPTDPVAIARVLPSGDTVRAYQAGAWS